MKELMPSNSPLPSNDTILPADTTPNRNGILSREAISPSLQRQGHAYEMKFVVDSTVVANVLKWARLNLTIDPYAAKDESEGYLIHTVYLDTPEYSTYFAEPYFRTRKFRLRRYGQEPVVWLEQKRKNKMRVRKRRVSVNEARVVDHLEGERNPDWDGVWFQQRLQSRKLKPVCQVSYKRRAFVGMTPTGPVRLTIDDNLTSSRCSNWRISGEPVETVQILPNHQILELKFQDVLPSLFRRLMDDLNLVPGTFSKYRNSALAVVHELANARHHQPISRKETSDVIGN